MKYILSVCLFGLLILLSCEKAKNENVSIAILTPVTHPSLEQIEKGFIQAMEASHPGRYTFVTYNAQGNKTLMRSEVDEIIRKDYALVFSIGTMASQMTKEVFSRKELTTPIVFTCVNDPLGFHMVDSEHTPGGTMTGVKEMLHFDVELSYLIQLKPDLKQLLLVYNPAEPGMQKDQKELARLCQAQGLILNTVEIFQTNELLAKVQPFIDKAEALIVLKDNTVVAGLDVLVKLCNRHAIPLMASDLDSPDKGAALGYGVYEVDFGTEAAKKALMILDEQVAPGTIPVTPVSHFVLRVNREAAAKQGLDLSLIDALTSKGAS